MLGILAQFLHLKTGKKVLVVVPTDFLHAYQQKFYCPYASNIPEEIGDKQAKYIFYCSFKRFSDANFILPLDTILLVDEFHDIFFN
jgi:hypothetical protein